MGFPGLRRRELPDELGRAARAAEACGVTRLADITRLDRLGVPVFQAVRPWSRALSVHLGKSLDAGLARLGALMEAIESAAAEAFEGDVRIAAFADLPPAERAGDPADFACDRSHAAPADEPLAWTAARRLIGGGVIWVPAEAVSLDFTRRGDRRIERTSNGLAAQFSADEAAVTALLELVERDALACWRARPLVRRSAQELDPDTVPFHWFAGLLAAVRGAGLCISLHRLEAVIPAPAFLCQLIEPGEARLSAGVYGSACDLSAELALQKAVLEAVQSRLAVISGARDDVYFPGAAREGLGLALPLPPSIPPLSWGELEAETDPSPARDLHALAAALAGAGCPDAALVALAAPGEGILVVKAFCPGLAAFERSRRAPAPC